MNENNENYDKILELFRKVISSLVCIIFKSIGESKAKFAKDILNDLIIQYDNYMTSYNVNLISFIYNSKDVDDFCNECYEIVELCSYAEDLEFGFTELIEEIIKEREVKNNG